MDKGDRVWIVLGLIALIYFLQSSHLSSIVPFTGPLSPIREWEYGATEPLSVTGTRLYAPVGNVMRVWDISNPANPVLLKEIQKAGNTIDGGPQCSQYVVSNDKMAADVLTATNQVVVIDANSFATKTLSYTDAQGLAVAGNNLYVGRLGSVSVVDVSNPTSATETKTLASISGSVFTNGSIIVTDSCGSDGTVRFSDMNGIVFRTRAFGEQITDVAFSPSYVIVSGYHSVWLYNPYTDTIAGTFNNGGYAHKVSAYGTNYMAVSSHDQDVELVDISNPSAPTTVGYYYYSQEIGGYPRDLQVFGGHYFALAVHYRGVALVDITSPSAPATAGKIPAFERSKVATISSDGKYAYDLDDLGLRVIDMTGEPRSVAYLDFASRGSGIAFDRTANILYCAVSWGGLKIVDVSNPTIPLLLQDWNPTQYVEAVAISGDRLYTAEDTTFVIYSRSNPKQIDTSHPLGHLSLSGRILGPILTYGNYAYAWLDQTIIVIDVSNPASPIQTATLSMPYVAGQMSIQGSNLYALDSIGNFEIFSLANPASPTQLYANRMIATYSGGLAVSGTSAFAGFGNNMVQMDVSNPGGTKITGQNNVGGYPANLEVANGYMVGAWGSDGIKEFQVGSVVQIGCDYNNPPCTAPQTCQSNVCVSPSPTGCQYNNPPCETNQTCTNNTCISNKPGAPSQPTGDFWAPLLPYWNALICWLRGIVGLSCS